MWIIIAGTVIASMISCALLLSSLHVGRRGDEWEEAPEQRAAPKKKTARLNKPATHAGSR